MVLAPFRKHFLTETAELDWLQKTRRADQLSTKAGSLSAALLAIKSETKRNADTHMFRELFVTEITRDVTVSLLERLEKGDARREALLETIRRKHSVINNLSVSSTSNSSLSEAQISSVLSKVEDNLHILLTSLFKSDLATVVRENEYELTDEKSGIGGSLVLGHDFGHGASHAFIGYSISPILSLGLAPNSGKLTEIGKLLKEVIWKKEEALSIFLVSEALRTFIRYNDLAQFYVARQRFAMNDVRNAAEKIIKKETDGLDSDSAMTELLKLLREFPVIPTTRLTLQGLRDESFSFLWPNKPIAGTNSPCTLCVREKIQKTSNITRAALFDEDSKNERLKAFRGVFSKKRITERLAVLSLITDLNELGWEWKDVGDDKVGFDIAAYDPINKKIYYIEVKGSTTGSVTYSRHELRFAQQHPYNAIQYEAYFGPEERTVRIHGDADSPLLTGRRTVLPN